MIHTCRLNELALICLKFKNMDPRFSLALLLSSNYPLILWVDTETIWVENPKNCCSIPGFCILFGDSLFCISPALQNQKKGKKTKEEKKGGYGKSNEAVMKGLPLCHKIRYPA